MINKKFKNYNRKLRYSLFIKLNFSICYFNQFCIHILLVFNYLNPWDGAWGALIDYCLGRQIAWGRLWRYLLSFDNVIVIVRGLGYPNNCPENLILYTTLMDYI